MKTVLKQETVVQCNHCGKWHKRTPGQLKNRHRECSACRGKIGKQYLLSHPEVKRRLKRRSRERYQLLHPEKAAASSKRNKERRYWADPELARAKTRRKVKLHRLRHGRVISKEETAREVTRKATRTAVKKGLLLKGPCRVCSYEKVEAHHLDYQKPLLVHWYCSQHHKAAHQ